MQPDYPSQTPSETPIQPPSHYSQSPSKSSLRQSFTLKPILAIVGIVTVFIIIILTFYISRIGKYKLKIQFAPTYAEIKINDKKYRNNSNIYLPSGEYEVSVNAPEFEPITYKLIVDENTEYIYGALNPATVLGDELKNDKLLKEFLDIEGIDAEVIQQYSDRILEQYPIFQYLPYQNTSKNGSIAIGYRLDDYAITIAVENFNNPNNISYFLETGISQLLSFAKESNKPIAEYKVEIKDFTNPFADIKPNSETNPQSFLKKAVSDLKIDPSTTTYNEEFHQDNYYYTTISLNNKFSYIPIVYRVVLIQNGNSWQFAGAPYPIATTTNMPNVPTEILTTINNLQVEYERE